MRDPRDARDAYHFVFEALEHTIQELGERRHITGQELLEAATLKREMPGVDMFLAMDRISDAPAPREVSGHFEVDPANGPHGHRPVYVVAHQGDDAKVWTSAVFITFK